MKNILCLVLILFFYFHSYSQIIYGAYNYTEYHQGTLPFVISVPHGGYLMPTSIPNRSCNNAVNVTDAYTIELAKQIDSAFFNITGCHPHIVYCNLHRAKLDCNRNIADGACGNTIAENAWNEFYNFIDLALSNAQVQFGDKTFYIDLHGHGNPIQRIELGYLLYDDELAFSDSILNTGQYIGYSTIQNLVATNINGFSHAELLRGNYALGTLFGTAGYPSVPSLQIPFPGTSTNYFSGGYNIANHTCYSGNNEVNGLQLECNYTHVRDSYFSRKQFADSLVAVLIQYMQFHQNINISNCASLNMEEPSKQNLISVYPNPAQGTVHISAIKPGNVTIYDVTGKLVKSTTMLTTTLDLNISDLQPGCYYLKAGNQKATKLMVK